MSTLLKEEVEQTAEVDLLMERLSSLQASVSRKKKDEDDFDFLDEMSPEIRELKRTLPRHLKQLNCHFNWDFQSAASDGKLEELIRRVIRKEEEIYLVERKAWRDYSHTLFLSYLYAETGSLDKAVALADEAKRCAESRQVGDIKDGLIYICDCIKATLWFRMKKWAQAEKLLNSMEKYEDLGVECKAAVLGVKASGLVETGMKGNHLALPVIREAIEIDPDHPEWRYILGKALARIRRYEAPHDIPGDEECEALEDAVRLAKSGGNSSHILLLSQTLREKSRHLYCKLGRKEQDLNSRALELINLALTLDPDDPNVNIRAADSLMKFPHPLRDLDRAEKCILKALESAPENTMVNHKAGTFHANTKEDYEEAKKYFRKAVECGASSGNFPADISLLNMEIVTEWRFDPFPRLVQLMERYGINNDHQAASVLTFRGCCHWLLRRDLKPAMENWLKAMGINAEAFRDSYVRHRSYKTFSRESTAQRQEDLLRQLEQEAEDCPSTAEGQRILRLRDICNEMKFPSAPRQGDRGRGRSPWRSQNWREGVRR